MKAITKLELETRKRHDAAALSGKPLSRGELQHAALIIAEAGRAAMAAFAPVPPGRPVQVSARVYEGAWPPRPPRSPANNPPGLIRYGSSFIIGPDRAFVNLVIPPVDPAAAKQNTVRLAQTVSDLAKMTAEAATLRYGASWAQKLLSIILICLLLEFMYGSKDAVEVMVGAILGVLIVPMAKPPSK